jgi:hypothetical protein
VEAIHPIPTVHILKTKKTQIISHAIKEKASVRLAVIGRLLPMLAIASLRGTSTSTTASSTTTIRPLAFTCVALEQDSNLSFDFLTLDTLSI